MKQIFIISILSFSCLLAEAQTEKSVLDLSRNKFRWMINMQYDSLGPVLDERLIFVHSNGWAENKNELMDDIKSGKLRYSKIEVSEATARMYPATAIVTGKGKFSVKLEGNDLVLNLFYTEVYVEKNGKWLLASRHANRLQ